MTLVGLQLGDWIMGGNRRVVLTLRRQASWSLGALEKCVHMEVGLLLRVQGRM